MAVGVLNVLNAVAVCGAIGVGFFKWDGHSVGDVSDQYPTLITPIGWAFGIWGIIYTFLLLFILWQLWPSNQESAPVKAIGPWLIIASLFQGLWIPTWCYDNMALASLLLLAVWVSLFNLNASLVHANLYSSSTANNNDSEQKGRLAHWLQTPSLRAILARLPFGFWFGWITLALTVNATIFFSYVLEIDFFRSTTWASLALAGAASFGLIWSVLTADFVFPFPGAWGALGIAAKHYNPNVTQVALTVSLTLLAFAIIHAVVRLVVLPVLSRRTARRFYQNEAEDELLMDDMRKVSFTPVVSPVHSL